MGQSLHRDGYGRPLPTLARPAVPETRSTTQNEAQQHLVQVILDDLYAQILHAGEYASVALHFEVVDGIIQHDMDLQILRRWRVPKD